MTLGTGREKGFADGSPSSWVGPLAEIEGESFPQVQIPL